jgi:hypothetical protein
MQMRSELIFFNKQAIFAISFEPGLRDGWVLNFGHGCTSTRHSCIHMSDTSVNYAKLIRISIRRDLRHPGGTKFRKASPRVSLFWRRAGAVIAFHMSIDKQSAVEWHFNGEISERSHKPIDRYLRRSSIVRTGKSIDINSKWHRVHSTGTSFQVNSALLPLRCLFKCSFSS